MPNFLTPYTVYLKIAGATAVAILVIWALRVDHLRAEHESQLAGIAAAVKTAGYPKNGDDDLAGDVALLAAARDTYKGNADRADAAIADQNQHIQTLGAATQMAQDTGVAAQKQAAIVTADRDKWIALARTAGARTTVLPDGQELAACKTALDALYAENF